MTVGAADMKKHALDLIVQRFHRVAKLPQIRQLSKDLLLEIIDTLAAQDISSSSYQDIIADD